MICADCYGVGTRDRRLNCPTCDGSGVVSRQAPVTGHQHHCHEGLVPCDAATCEKGDYRPTTARLTARSQEDE